MPIDRHARLIAKEFWNDYFLLSIESPIIAGDSKPGQFVMVKTSLGSYPLLRRPFSLHLADSSTIQLFFKKIGTGTEALARKNQGDEIDLLGPLGNGFSLDSGLEGKTAWLVGGGRGIAPLLFLARELARKKTTPVIFYGGRSESDLPLRQKLEQLGFRILCSTDDGSYGFRGFVTDLVASTIKNERPAMVYACGPDPMMKTLQKMALREGIPAEFSLESIMGCGIGACWGCVHRIEHLSGSAWTRVCAEGPIFQAEKIIWTD